MTSQVGGQINTENDTIKKIHDKYLAWAKKLPDNDNSVGVVQNGGGSGDDVDVFTLLEQMRTRIMRPQ